MKKTLLSLSILFTGLCGYAQYEGFENWTQNSVLQLDDYQTTVNDLGAFGNNAVSRVADPVDGTYSIKLETIIAPGGDTAFGYFLSGDPDALAPGQPVTIGNVDSLIGYYKYDVMPGDSATILAATTQTGFGLTGGSAFYVTGTQSTWKRFAYYIGAPLADSLLIAAATGDPLNEFNGIPGTWIQFDKIQLKSSTSAVQNIQNFSFENWTPITWDEPNGWMTSNQWAVSSPTMPAVKSTDSYSGSFALELNTIQGQFGDTIEGMATNGYFTDMGVLGGVPFTGQPTAVNFFYKYFPSGVDTAWAWIQFKKNGAQINGGGTQLTAGGTYQMSSNLMPVFSMVPDTFLMACGAGRNPGSQLIVDHIDFTFPVGINENIKVERIVTYPNPATDVLNIRFELKTNNIVSVRLLDVTGKIVATKSLGNLTTGTYNESFNTSDFNAGVYFIEFTIGDEKTINRFLVK